MIRRQVVIGAGVMGEVLVAAAKKSGHEALIVEADPTRAAEVAKGHQVKAVDLAAALADSDQDTTIWLAIKPQQIRELLKEIEAQLSAAPPQARPLFVSLAAGVGTGEIAQVAPSITRLVRVMPNTPARIGRGVTAVVSTPSGSSPAPLAQDLALVEQLLTPLGSTEQVTETEVDAVTVISGSGPAYLFYLAEAMVEAAVSLGLSAEVATRLVNETLAGSAELLRVSNSPANKLRNDVTSKGGVTLAATSYLDDNAIKAHLVAAIAAAHERAKEIARVSSNS